MSRRNGVRRANKNLDEEQTKDAMKVLEKYCKAKYRNSILINTNDIDQNVSEPFTPNSLPLSSVHFPSRQITFDRQSTFISSSHLDSRSPLTPAFAFDFTEHSVKEEIKFDKETETWTAYISRISKYFYHYFGIKHLLLVLILVSYALIGGYVFMSIEHPAQSKTDLRLIQSAESRHNFFSKHLLLSLYDGGCIRKLTHKKDLEVQILYNNSLCSITIRSSLANYDKSIRRELEPLKQWKWDYWNAVFYAGTIFTTIGYGNLTCTTVLGRMVTILYAIIGIPMMLVVLNIIGKSLFGRLQHYWALFRRKFRKKMGYIKKNRLLKRFSTTESVISDEILDVKVQQIDDESANDDPDLFETFPMSLALLIVFGFIMLCSILFSYWEQWDFFTAFYFFFISLSTVGFGDVIPEHPKYACVSFAFYFIGLALVSMCYAIIQVRWENQYMWALQLIDQEHQDMLESQNEGFEEKEDKTLKAIGSTTSIRWRKGGEAQESPASVEIQVEKPEDEKRLTTVMVSAPGESPLPPPPVLGVFISRTISTKRKSNLARSESVLSKSTNNSKFRPFSYSPTSSEMLTPSDCINKSPWHFTSADMPAQTSSFLGPRPAGSAPIISSRGTPSFPLSVITEVNDEDTLHSRRSSRKLPPLKRLESTYEAPTLTTHIEHKADMKTLSGGKIEESLLPVESTDSVSEAKTTVFQKNIGKNS